MEPNAKKIKRTSLFINAIVAIALAVFLIGLGMKVVNDLDSTFTRPVYTDFCETDEPNSILTQIRSLEKSVQLLNAEKENLSKTVASIRVNIESEQTSFDNWLKTRDIIGEPSEDNEVIAKVNKLDELQKVELSWMAKVQEKEKQISEFSRQMTELRTEQYKIDQVIKKEFDAAYHSYSIKVFLVRLLFVLPILALGVYFFFKKRRSRYRAMYMGFTLFSLYAFFIGLVPYFPSFGAYIRNGVGIILTLGIGYYAIKYLKNYSDRKRAELQLSSQDRAKKLKTEVIEKSYDKHNCPSCGKDFLLKEWEITSGDSSPHSAQFCQYCGLELMKDCGNCGQTNYAYLSYCSSCGVSTQSDKNQ